ncbi:hypothetical protein D3C87_1622570 [compost metagenome]
MCKAQGKKGTYGGNRTQRQWGGQALYIFSPVRMGTGMAHKVHREIYSNSQYDGTGTDRDDGNRSLD